MDAHLTLTAKPEVIDSVSSFCYRWCINSGLRKDEATRFALALDELITNIILFAYPDESGTFEVTFRNSMSNVESIITESGEPFDPDRHTYDKEKALQKNDFEGAGFELIRHFSDDFMFINRGKQGKEFRISKAIEESHIKEMQPNLQVLDQESSAKDREYHIHTITPTDAEDISKLIYRTYDYSYSKEDMYFPKKVERAIAQKKKIGVITRIEEGEAVGYFAIIKKEDSNIAEVGEAVVSPAHRRRGLMTRMMEKLIEIARNQGLLGLYATAITSHPISQRVNNKFGFVSTALVLAESEALQMKLLREDYPQPTSTVLDFLPLKDVPRPPLHLPEIYESILSVVYSTLGVEIKIADSSKVFLDQRSNIDVKIDYKDHISLILVESYGEDFEETFDEISASLEDKKLNTIYADLPLDHPATPHFLDFISGKGFVFSGLMPAYHHEKDYLRVQKIISELNLDLIEVYSEHATMIKDLVSEEYYASKS